MIYRLSSALLSTETLYKFTTRVPEEDELLLIVILKQEKVLSFVLTTGLLLTKFQFNFYLLSHYIYLLPRSEEVIELSNL